jgi:hypothetical protein
VGIFGRHGLSTKNSSWSMQFTKVGKAYLVSGYIELPFLFTYHRVHYHL